MSSNDSAIAVMQRFYEAERAYVMAGGAGRAGFEEIAACLDPQVELHQAPGLPFTGVWHGPEGMERFIAVMGELWESMEFLEQRQLVDRDTVVATNRVRFVARATGREVVTSIVQTVTLRDGRIREIRPYYWDPAAISEACGGRVVAPDSDGSPAPRSIG
ncbi:nuclear transport factor 2 family protein [Streptomyces sp. NPDC021212]|uniref:nuclear transport factor 2 family protein n=1 Tax=Streptomyces sp. NPDC021212 TaxID=3365118 RepID=UPI0037B7A959